MCVCARNRVVHMSKIDGPAACGRKVVRKSRQWIVCFVCWYFLFSLPAYSTNKNVSGGTSITKQE